MSELSWSQIKGLASVGGFIALLVSVALILGSLLGYGERYHVIVVTQPGILYLKDNSNGKIYAVVGTDADEVHLPTQDRERNQ